MSSERSQHDWPPAEAAPDAPPEALSGAYAATPPQSLQDEAVPEEVRVEETMDGARYVLPGRVLGGGHVFGAAVVVAGIVIVLAGLWWAMAILLNGPLAWPGNLIDLIGPTTVILIGIVIWTSGLFIASGRAELEFHGGPPATLRRVERAGLLRWTSRQPVARLNRLRIDMGLTEDKTIDEAITAGVALPLASLVGEYEDGKTARLLAAYPAPWLESIAHDLADRLEMHPARQDSAALRPEVIVRDPQRDGDQHDRHDASRRAAGAGGEGGDDDFVVQPPDSVIDISRTRDGLTITIPPLSMWRDRKGAYSLGAVGNGIMAAVTGSAFGFASSPLYLTLAIAVFWGIGSLVMLAAISMGRRTAIIDVVEERAGRSLLISQRSYFGVRQRGWRRGDLRTVACGPSGMEVNEKPVMELQITPASGGTESFFTGRDEDELRWLARVLREALDLREETAEAS